MYPEIRLLKAGGVWTPSWNGQPDDTEQRELRDFSAVCYMTAVAIKQHTSPLLTVPIGLVQASVGGTIIEAWAPSAVARECGMADAQDGGKTACAGGPVQTYSTLFEAAIAPLLPMRITATLWYQGEVSTAIPATPIRSLALSRIVGLHTPPCAIALTPECGPLSVKCRLQPRPSRCGAAARGVLRLYAQGDGDRVA